MNNGAAHNWDQTIFWSFSMSSLIGHGRKIRQDSTLYMFLWEFWNPVLANLDSLAIDLAAKLHFVDQMDKEPQQYNDQHELP